MIFIGGVHGVGKTTFCLNVKEKLGLNFYSASGLISKYKKHEFPKNKFVSDIDGNQYKLISIKKILDEKENQYLLDGHFCLFDSNGNLQRINSLFFKELAPDAIVLLTEEPSIIAERRKQRDAIECNEEDIQICQIAEMEYGKNIADLLSIPIFILQGSLNINNAIIFIENIV